MTSIRNINNPYFKLKIGTFDKKNPETIFIEGSAYVMPEFDGGYGEALLNLRKQMNSKIKDILTNNEYFYNDFIEILDAPTERMKKGKKSFLYFECHLKQKGNKTFNEIIKRAIEINEIIINQFKNNIIDSGFQVVKSK